MNYEAQNAQPETRNLAPATQTPETSYPDLGGQGGSIAATLAWNPPPEPEPETSNPKPETRNPKRAGSETFYPQSGQDGSATAPRGSEPALVVKKESDTVVRESGYIQAEVRPALFFLIFFLDMFQTPLLYGV